MSCSLNKIRIIEALQSLNYNPHEDRWGAGRQTREVRVIQSALWLAGLRRQSLEIPRVCQGVAKKWAISQQSDSRWGFTYLFNGRTCQFLWYFSYITGCNWPGASRPLLLTIFALSGSIKLRSMASEVMANGVGGEKELSEWWSNGLTLLINNHGGCPLAMIRRIVYGQTLLAVHLLVLPLLMAIDWGAGWKAIGHFNAAVLWHNDRKCPRPGQPLIRLLNRDNNKPKWSLFYCCPSHGHQSELFIGAGRLSRGARRMQSDCLGLWV